MSKLEHKIIRELTDKIYGPKFCKKCDQIQSIIVYQLKGSDHSKLENNILTYTFTGQRICSVCYHEIEEKK